MGKMDANELDKRAENAYVAIGLLFEAINEYDGADEQYDLEPDDPAAPEFSVKEQIRELKPTIQFMAQFHGFYGIWYD
jgi:hypothetical protein